MPEQQRKPLHCPNCGAGEQHLEIDRPALLMGELRFYCTVCLEPVEPEPEPAGAAA